ncbi:MAG: pyridoxamine 5'-phosphate oxidase family protein [Armatimonadetes bacterium]|nr:pyridoxamine 5'-phosphate oxidase family protein [Armatimonadota bacterium]
MLPDKAIGILKHEAPVAIATASTDGRPHVVGTWNSYVELEGNTLLIPAGHFNRTEENLASNNKIEVMIASKEVEGNYGLGAGFLISGTASFQNSGPLFDRMKSRFDWARAVLVVNVDKCEQTL